MRNNTLIAILGGIALVAALVWIAFLRSPEEGAPGTPNNNTNDSVQESPVRVFEPLSGDAISSPLAVRGEARGTWYFEASFPVRLLDANGNELAVTPAQAQGEWMTEDYVAFSAELSFQPSSTETGTLVLEKDNPSGLPEHADEIRIPILFADPGAQMSVTVFFGNTIKDPEVLDCSRVFSVTRTIPKTQAIARAALNELLAGPTAQEAQAGYTTSINSGVEIQSLVIEDATAKVDFTPRLDEDMGGSCRVTAIRSQITETLKQFPTVDDVVISIDGETDLILQP